MRAQHRPELDHTTLAARIRDHGRETQLFLNSVLVSVAVSERGLCICASARQRYHADAVAAIYPGQLWLVLIHVFSGTSSTSLLIVSLPDWRAAVFIAAGHAVFLMFSTLIPRIRHAAAKRLVRGRRGVTRFIEDLDSKPGRKNQRDLDTIRRFAMRSEAHLKSMPGSAIACGFERQVLVGDDG